MGKKVRIARETTISRFNRTIVPIWRSAIDMELWGRKMAKLFLPESKNCKRKNLRYGCHKEVRRPNAEQPGVVSAKPSGDTVKIAEVDKGISKVKE